jgi:serine/threonine protein kinase
MTAGLSLSATYTETVDPLCGVILDGRYRVAEVVGIGGMGVVYRAEQVNAHGRDVAIKVLSPRVVGTTTVTKRFETEARIISQLRHPNTLKLIDSGRFPDGRLYIVTEFLFGKRLDDIRDDLIGNPVRTLRIVRQVCDSLAEAHELGIVHRDLKPTNIFLEQVAGQEIVKVLDFGLAKLLELPGLTLPMRICGTPGFMAPEQICGQAIDARADIYALGAILYECISGEPPFSAPSLHALLMKHVTDPAPALVDLRVDVNGDLSALVASMLAKDPKSRPESVARVREELDRIELGIIAGGHAPESRVPAAVDGDTSIESETEDLIATHPSRPGLDMSFPPEHLEGHASANGTPVEMIGSYGFELETSKSGRDTLRASSKGAPDLLLEDLDEDGRTTVPEPSTARDRNVVDEGFSTEPGYSGPRPRLATGDYPPSYDPASADPGRETMVEEDTLRPPRLPIPEGPTEVRPLRSVSHERGETPTPIPEAPKRPRLDDTAPAHPVMTSLWDAPPNPARVPTEDVPRVRISADRAPPPRKRSPLWVVAAAGVALATLLTGLAAWTYLRAP